MQTQTLTRPKRKRPVRNARFCMERMTVIAALIKGGGNHNATTLARHFEVCTKTIQRDLDFLRDRIGMNFVWSSERRCYVVEPAIPLPWWIGSATIPAAENPFMD